MKPTSGSELLGEVPADWTRIEKTDVKVPLAKRPPTTGPKGDALITAVKGRTFTSSAMTFAFQDRMVRITWPKMKGDPLIAELRAEGDLMAIEIGNQPNTLNQRFLVEGTTNCALTIVHRRQRGMGESILELALTDESPTCAE